MDDYTISKKQIIIFCVGIILFFVIFITLGILSDKEKKKAQDNNVLETIESEIAETETVEEIESTTETENDETQEDKKVVLSKEYSLDELKIIFSKFDDGTYSMQVNATNEADLKISMLFIDVLSKGLKNNFIFIHYNEKNLYVSYKDGELKSILSTENPLGGTPQWFLDILEYSDYSEERYTEIQDFFINLAKDFLE